MIRKLYDKCCDLGLVDSIGRVEKEQRERLSAETSRAHGVTHVPGVHARLLGDVEGGDVASQGDECRTVSLDEGRMRGAPGEGFETEGSRARERVEHTGAAEIGAET